MSSAKRVAVVTGANKGIGFAIVRGLCKQFDGDVILTARSESNGKEAIEKLNKEGLKPVFHQMDLSDVSSIDKLKNFLQTNYGGLDVLVNNAGIAFKTAATDPFPVQAEVTMATNFWGTLNVCKSMLPVLRPHARVVNVSSMLCQSAAKKCSQNLISQFADKNLDMPKVEQLMTEFVNSAKDGTFKAKGWPGTAYGVTKIGVTLMSFVQQKNLNNDESRPDIVVNADGHLIYCTKAVLQHVKAVQQDIKVLFGVHDKWISSVFMCCPGYVDTDMTSHKGRKTIDQGADTPLYLAMLPPNTTSPKGNFVQERKISKFP